jgi:hypothetical protein
MLYSIKFWIRLERRLAEARRETERVKERWRENEQVNLILQAARPNGLASNIFIYI